jgi:hypothetical protein
MSTFMVLFSHVKVHGTLQPHLNCYVYFCTFRCLLYQLTKSTTDKNKYVVMELYENQEAVAAHGKTDYFKRCNKKMGPYLGGENNNNISSSRLHHVLIRWESTHTSLLPSSILIPRTASNRNVHAYWKAMNMHTGTTNAAPPARSDQKNHCFICAAR